MGVTPSEYAQVGPFPKFPTAKWFLAAYVRNVWTRLPALLAALTSTYGRILKIDSTKKVCRKLQGKAADTASWATSVGNERGEVLLTVLTSSEGAPALKPLADGWFDGIGKQSSNHPSYSTQTVIAAVPPGHPSISSSFLNGMA